MKSILLQKPGLVQFQTAPLPKPLEDEVLVKIRRIGVCGTDFHAFQGKQPFFTYPRTLGHELAAEIAEVGDRIDGLRKGDVCAVEPYLTCGRCIACRCGKANCCVELRCLGVHVDGGMCEYLSVPAKNLHKSDRLTLDQLALVEPLCIGAHAVERASVRLGEWVLVIGAGPIGLATTQFALAKGATVVVMDVNESRLRFTKGALGIKYCIDATRDPLAQLEKLVPELPSAVFDCTGNQSSMEDSFRYVAHGGRLTFVGLIQGNVTFSDPHFHRREMTLLSSRNSNGGDFRRVIGLLENGTINVDDWITHRCAFDELIDALPRWADPKTGVIKGLVEL